MLTEKSGYVYDYDRPVAVTFNVDEEGVREGVYKTWHINDASERIGEFQTFWYTAGVLNGKFKAYNVDGKLTEEGCYSNGKMHGVFREYLDGKLIVQCLYKNDLVDGKFTRWRDIDKGILESNIHYKNGVPQWLMQFDENSMIKRVVYYDENGAGVEEDEYKRTEDRVYFCKRTRDSYREEIYA
jgi:antitoxin component YwqK of YwqJK toxin-antitoxin module